jgi:uncharacterized protein (DUF1330 family)
MGTRGARPIRIGSGRHHPPRGIVVIAFDSTEKALAWYNSPAYEAIKPIRQGASVSRMFMAEGLPPQ